MDPEKSALVAVSDVEACEDRQYESTFSKALCSLPRYMASKILTRRNLVSTCFISALLYFYYHGSDEFNVNGRPCAWNRTNPHQILAPQTPDTAYLSELWSDLQTTFDSHPPDPAHIDHPKHDGPGFPPKEKIGSDFNITKGQAANSRAAHELVKAKLPKYPRRRFSGRGVVMLAGGKYSEFAATSLGVLREVGSRMPVEVWAKDASEDIPGWCTELEREGMACRHLANYMDTASLKHPYQWKIFTILFSSFDDVLFLDADSMPIRNPDFVFDSDNYRSKGALLWPDYWRNSASPWATYETGITSRPDDSVQDTMSVESGQLFWSKSRHWKSLLLATYYNYWGPDHFYTVFNNGYAGWGDKDTLPMALNAAGEDYHMVPHGIATAFVNGTILGIGMLQADPTNDARNDPLFMHSNIVKWSVRKFFCQECEALPSHKLETSHLVNENAAIHEHLKEGRRIFNTNEFREKGIDPEPLMWKAFEYTACRSNAWAIEGLCLKTRSFMERAFGSKFIETGPNNRLGPSNQICLENPGVVG